MRNIMKELAIFIPAIITLIIVALAVTPIAKAVDIGTINTVKAAGTTEAEDAPIPLIDVKKDTKDADATSAESISVPNDDSLDGQKFKDGTYAGIGKGFNGNIHVEVTIEDGEISNIIVTQHSDDQPYLGNALALIDNIVKTQSVAVDTVSGATYSSRGIINAVKNALEKAIGSDDTDTTEVSPKDSTESNPRSSSTSEDTSLDGQKFKDGTYTGVGKGYNGNIHVNVTIKDGKISTIKVTQHSDDQPYMGNAMALVGNIVKTQSVAVDTVSGATYSSKGIISAVKNALKKAIVTSDSSLDDSDDTATTETSPESDSESSTSEVTSLDGQRFKDGIYTGAGKGFNGNIHVEVTIKDGKISTIKITQHSDDQPYISNAMALVANIVKTQSATVDAVSGATYSSRGIINAVKNALKKAVVTSDPSLEETVDSTTSDSNDATPGSTEEDAAQDAEEDNNYDTVYGQYVDGTYVGKARGYKSIFTATVAIKNGTIDSIDIEQADDDAYYSKCVGILQRIIARQTTEGIDTVSGCTSSSNGLLNSVKAALTKAAPPEVADTDDAETDDKETGE